MLAKRGWSLLFLAIAAFYLYGLGALPLTGPDEPRYAEVAREMLIRRDFVTPTLGGLPWFEKPPLLYWMTMASYRVLGVSEYAARLGPALCGLLTAAFVYWIGKTIRNSQIVFDSTGKAANDRAEQSLCDLAPWSALVVSSSVGVMAFSRAASFDIVVTMTLTGALACFFIWHSRYRTARGSERVRSAGILACGSPAFLPAVESAAHASNGWLILGFYFFIGLSLLAKGLIGIVIPFGVVTGYWLLRREWPNRRFLKSLLWGFPVVIMTAGVWYGPMISRHGWAFIDQFIIQHHFARFVTNKYHHPEPFYFYLPVLAALALPWTIVLAAAFISARRWNWRGDTPVDRLRVFALAWIVVPVVFFSFSGSKLTAYILPVMPAVALLVGERVTCFLSAGRGDKVLRLTGLLLIVLNIFGGCYLVRKFSVPLACVTIATCPLVAVGATALFFPRIRRALFLLIPLAGFAASGIAINCAAPIVARGESVRDLLAAASARGYGAAPVVQLHTVERTAELYAFGRVSYWSDGEPIKLEGVTQVADAARRSGVVLCLVPIEYESQLTAYPWVQTEVIGNNGRVALVAARSR
jgi:4-amino-4-deoxy-L-arabinose transferase-like glycosyltransferase